MKLPIIVLTGITLAIVAVAAIWQWETRRRDRVLLAAACEGYLVRVRRREHAAGDEKLIFRCLLDGYFTSEQIDEAFGRN